ncbi:MAG: twin-arginine translocation pathway signal protein [Novosphingobium sp.]
MDRRQLNFGLIAALATLSTGPAFATEAKPSLVPAEFNVPTLVEAKGFKLVPLGPGLVKIDFTAYMSSIEHLQKTFTRSTAWPHPGITDAEAMVDMQTEQARFTQRKSFAYAVLTPDGMRERGCVYIQPSPVAGYDAVVLMWVTKAEFDAGFDAELQAWVMKWIASDWPFKSVAFPGRAISWDKWDALAPAKAH